MSVTWVALLRTKMRADNLQEQVKRTNDAVQLLSLSNQRLSAQNQAKDTVIAEAIAAINALLVEGVEGNETRARQMMLRLGQALR